MRNPKDSVLPESRNSDEGSNRDLATCDSVSFEALKKLRDQWDARLASLDVLDAGDRLSKVMETPCGLNGEVIAGETH